MSTDFSWINGSSDNELYHGPSKAILAQIFKHEYDPIDKVQTWKMLLPWQETYMVFNRRVNAKAWALSEVKDYVERNWTATGWKPGTSPEEVREAIAARLVKRDDPQAEKHASESVRLAMTRLRAEHRG